MFNVINGKVDGFIGQGKIYIGRFNKFYNLNGSLLQNRFVIGKDGNREQVIEEYRNWLWDELNKKGAVYRELIRIAEKVKNGENVSLVCWCKPLGCHGDVVQECIEWLIKMGWAD